MSSLLITNIGRLVQVETRDPQSMRCGRQMSSMPYIDNAFLYCSNGLIKAFGPMQQLPNFLQSEEVGREEDCRQEIDARGRMVFPSFCDCHSHIVYAGSREKEFMDKIRGLDYEEIARRGGGILNSAALLHNTSEEELFEQAMVRVREMIGFGTGALEIKSGYGLNTEDELKMLRVIRRISQECPLQIKATFLGAHALPQEYKTRKQDYVDLIINEMIPMVSAENLADYIDVFCERGFFSVEDTERIFMAGIKYGLRPKVHANQMDFSGGVETGVKYGAISVDHLEHTGTSQIEALCAAKGDTMPVLLPGATFFLEMDYAPARAMIDAGLPVALASNYNPGSCPSGDMKFMMALSCLKYKMTPEEAFNAATINSAYAMGLSDTVGSIAIGKIANFFIAKPVPSYEYLPYAFSSPLIDEVFLNGKSVKLC